MRFKLLLLFVLFCLFFGCKKRKAEDYKYYQPYRKDSASFVSKVAEIPADTLQHVEQPEADNLQHTKLNLNLSNEYFIVVASYVNEENALAQKAKLLKQGFNAEIIVLNKDGWFKLAIASFKSLAEAELELELLIANKRIAPDARIVFRSNKQ
jgi:cell division protein FtsN